jgi:hypothetical protein
MPASVTEQAEEAVPEGAAQTEAAAPEVAVPAEEMPTEAPPVEGTHEAVKTTESALPAAGGSPAEEKAE